MFRSVSAMANLTRARGGGGTRQNVSFLCNYVPASTFSIITLVCLLRPITTVCCKTLEQAFSLKINTPEETICLFGTSIVHFGLGGKSAIELYNKTTFKSSFTSESASSVIISLANWYVPLSATLLSSCEVELQ